MSVIRDYWADHTDDDLEELLASLSPGHPTRIAVLDELDARVRDLATRLTHHHPQEEPCPAP